MNIVIEEKPFTTPEYNVSNDYINMDNNIHTEIDNVLAKEMDYSINYTLPALHHICGFYEISYKRIKKQELIRTLVEFESLPENMEIVQKRKQYWFYMEELKQNKYLSKYIISM